MESLVTTDWLAKELGASDLRIVDATKFLPGGERDAREHQRDAGHGGWRLRHHGGRGVQRAAHGAPVEHVGGHGALVGRPVAAV